MLLANKLDRLEFGKQAKNFQEALSSTIKQTSNQEVDELLETYPLIFREVSALTG